MGMTTMGVKLDDATRERIKTAATRIDRTPHWLIKQAIFNYLERLESDEACRSCLPAGRRGERKRGGSSRWRREPSAVPRIRRADPAAVRQPCRHYRRYRRAETDAVPMLLEQARLPEAIAAQAHSLAYQ